MYTIIKNTEHIYQINGSKFYSFAYSILNKDEAVNIINNLKELHKKAKHICYAYSYFNNNKIEYSYYESTEPKGTSGKQILSIITKNNLINVLIVVIRYMHNTKLGIGLLSRTYQKMAISLINNNIHKFLQYTYENITIPLSKLDQFKKDCSYKSITILKIDINNEIANIIIKKYLE